MPSSPRRPDPAQGFGEQRAAGFRGHATSEHKCAKQKIPSAREYDESFRFAGRKVRGALGTGVSFLLRYFNIELFGLECARVRRQRRIRTSEAWLHQGFLRRLLLSALWSCRMMTALPPDRLYIDCPACGRPHCHSGLLATGYTRQRSLPQHEVWTEPVSVARIAAFLDDLPIVRPKPRRQLLTRGQRLSAARS